MSEKSQYTCIISINDQIFFHLTKSARDRFERQILRDNNVNNAYCFRIERASFCAWAGDQLGGSCGSVDGSDRVVVVETEGHKQICVRRSCPDHHSVWLV